MCSLCWPNRGSLVWFSCHILCKSCHKHRVQCCGSWHEHEHDHTIVFLCIMCVCLQITFNTYVVNRGQFADNLEANQLNKVAPWLNLKQHHFNSIQITFVRVTLAVDSFGQVAFFILQCFVITLCTGYMTNNCERCLTIMHNIDYTRTMRTVLRSLEVFDSVEWPAYFVTISVFLLSMMTVTFSPLSLPP